MEEIKIGEFVRRYLENIFEYCEENPEEFLRLQDKEYSKDTFGINYPFCMERSKVFSSHLSNRYWRKKYRASAYRIRVTNDWYVGSFDKLSIYLLKKKLITNQELKQFKIVTSESQKNKTAVRKRKNSRYKGWAIGNAQNLTIRNILSNLGSESFSVGDWKATKEYFGNKCAYCGLSDNLEMEHAVPINKEKLGEHRLGNIIPSCKSCNKKKHKKSYIEFLDLQTERIRTIKIYMDSKEYTPITENPEVKSELDKAYCEVGEIAKKYIENINELLLNTIDKKDN